MAIALDTSILLDVLLAEPAYATASGGAMRRVSHEGLIVSEAVLAELVPVTDGDIAAITQFLGDWKIEFVPISSSAAFLAGQMYSSFLKRGGKRGRILPDFLIDAHARLQATAPAFPKKSLSGHCGDKKIKTLQNERRKQDDAPV
jgi:predicted nucleic acid-binding protein